MHYLILFFLHNSQVLNLNYCYHENFQIANHGQLESGVSGNTRLYHINKMQAESRILFIIGLMQSVMYFQVIAEYPRICLSRIGEV